MTQTAPQTTTGADTPAWPPTAQVEEYHDVDPARFAAEIATAYRPVVLRGLVADWQMVAAAREGMGAAADYLKRRDNGAPLRVMCGQPAIGTRFFYREDMGGFNFVVEQASLPALLEKIVQFAGAPNPPVLYAGSAPTEGILPDFERENPMPLPTPGGRARIWIGNATHVTAHFDMSDNIAAVAMGRRRFTLFPPEQLPNLYVGPIEKTLAGQPVSMVDLRDPDLDRFPRFAEAMDHALTAELEPGDAIFIPKMWWHGVVASEPMNILVNYWYHEAEHGEPFAALVHAMMAIREMSSPERAALRSWFDHYVFADDAPQAVDHLPVHARGVLGAPDATRNDSIRGFLRRTLERK